MIIVTSFFCALFITHSFFCQSIDKNRLKELVFFCEGGNTDGLIIYKDGQIVQENYFKSKLTKIDIKTKSITNLATGNLVSQNKLSIDKKIYEFYPEWKQENQKDFTRRHLLTHSSWLLDADFSLVETAPDNVKLAFASDLSQPVGQYYAYNNKCVNLMVEIIEKVDGRKIDVLMKERIFGPMGITDFNWPKDKSENRCAMAFLQIYPKDLLKIGQLVLKKGKVDQHINISRFKESLMPGSSFMPEYGLWEPSTKNFRFIVDDSQIEKMVKAGDDIEFMENARSMTGVYRGQGAYNKKLREVYAKDFNTILQRKLVPYGLTVGRKQTDSIARYAGIGYLGQYLNIYPEYNLLAVRVINHYEGYDWDSLDIPEFVKALV